MKFIRAISKPRVMNAPVGSRITIRGYSVRNPKAVKPKIVPNPKISLIEARIVNPNVNPKPIPKASANERDTGWREENSSALARIMQFTTIKGT